MSASSPDLGLWRQAAHVASATLAERRGRPHDPGWRDEPVRYGAGDFEPAARQFPRRGHAGEVRQPERRRPQRFGFQATLSLNGRETPPRHRPRHGGQRQQTRDHADRELPGIAPAPAPGRHGQHGHEDCGIYLCPDGDGGHQTGDAGPPRRERNHGGDRHRRGNHVITLQKDMADGGRRQRIHDERQRIGRAMAVAKPGPDERGLDQRVQAEDEHAEEQPVLADVFRQHRRPGKPRKDVRRVIEAHVNVDPLAVEQRVRSNMYARGRRDVRPLNSLVRNGRVPSDQSATPSDSRPRPGLMRTAIQGRLQPSGSVSTANRSGWGPQRLEARANQRGDLLDADALQAQVVVAGRPPLVERTDARAAGVSRVDHVRLVLSGP